MGGQACVFYGAAEFSRDVDLAILINPDNLERLHAALRELDAEPVAVPPFGASFLQRGHAIHFRSRHPDARGIRIDVMAVMRGVAPFADLWSRRTTIDTAGLVVDLLSLPDLVQAKKTQRDKDWPMIRRLVEADYFTNRERASEADVAFWLRELRTPLLLVEAAAAHGEAARSLQDARPLLRAALRGDTDAIELHLSAEEAAERARDREYWAPLKAELEALRRAGP